MTDGGKTKGKDMNVSKKFLNLKFLKAKSQARKTQNKNKITQVIKDNLMETKKGSQSILSKFLNTF